MPSFFLTMLLAYIEPASTLTLREMLDYEIEPERKHSSYVFWLKLRKDEPDKQRLLELSNRAFVAINNLSSEWHKKHYRLKLACNAYDAGLTSFASRQAHDIIQGLISPADLTKAATRFSKHGMRFYARMAALKAIRCMKSPEEEFELYSLQKLLTEMKEYDALERVLLHRATQENRCFITLERLHADLYAIGKVESAKHIAQKIISVIQKEFPQGAGWYHHIARKMFERGARNHARLLMDRAFLGENMRLVYQMSWLIQHIVSAEKMGFADLATKGRKAYLGYFSERPTLERLRSHLRIVLESGEVALAGKMCAAALEKPIEFISFSYGIEVVDLLKTHDLDNWARRVFRKVQQSCVPTEFMALVFCLKGLGSFIPTEALVCLTLLANGNGWADEEESCAQASAASVLHYPFFESCKHFTGVLDWLAGHLSRLGYDAEEFRVRNFMREAQAPSPPRSLNSRYSVGQIIWYENEVAEGSEIKKKRPWLIVANPTSYGRREVVRVVPMSTQKKPEVPRMVLFVDGVTTKGEPVDVTHQELRFDQIRTISVTQIQGLFGSLSTHETLRAILLLKDSF